LSEHLDRGEHVDAVYTDFQKASDKVNHAILLSKMNNLGFDAHALKFFQVYLINRIQYVGYKHTEPENFTCPSGVPQGSNLGPLLFALFVNDINKSITNSNALLYADDMKNFRKIECKEDCFALQKDLDSIVKWSENNRLPLSVGKCEKITFT